MKYITILLLIASLSGCGSRHGGNNPFWKQDIYEDVQSWVKSSDSTFWTPFSYLDDAEEWADYVRKEGFDSIEVIPPSQDGYRLGAVIIHRNKNGTNETDPLFSPYRKPRSEGADTNNKLVIYERS